MAETTGGTGCAVRRLILTIGVLALTAGMGGVPAHADSLGDPDWRFAHSDGDVGVMELIYNLPGTDLTVDSGAARSLEAKCTYVTLPSVGSQTLTVIVTAEASAVARPNEMVVAAATGVVCEIRTESQNIEPVQLASPGPAGVATGLRQIRFDEPIQFCATPSVLWSDTRYDIDDTPECI